MRQRYIPAFIMLIAGAVTSIIDIVNGTPRLDSLKRLLLVLIIFYIIGLIAKALIKKATELRARPETEEEQEANLEEDNIQDNNRQEAAKDEKTGPSGIKKK